MVGVVSLADFVTGCYWAFLGRGPELGDVAAWSHVAIQAKSLNPVVVGFVTSAEFRSTHDSLMQEVTT